MAWYPKAVRKPVSRYRPGGSSAVAMTSHRRVVEHTAVSNSSSLYGLFATPGNATSHFYVAADGTVEQYIDTRIRSTANLEGNPDCITVETWDGYGNTWHGGSPGPRWTKAQEEALADLARWCHKVHGIPMRRLKSSRPGTRGVGWHRQGIDGNFPSGLLRGRVAGGEHWSSSFGKVCPTDTRIKQVRGIIRRARKGGEPKGLKVNRHRVNEVIDNPGKKLTKYARKHCNAVAKALRKNGLSVEGWPEHVNSLERAIRKFQEDQGWTGKDADGRLGPATCRLLGLRSRKGGGGKKRRVHAMTKTDNASSK